jgi:hypothetical protein
LSEVGFEVLYWVPFLKRLVRELEIDPDRLTAISRGGVAAWYEGVCSDYREIFSEVDPDEFRTRNEERWQSTGGQKHMAFGPWERELIRRLGFRTRGLSLIHPSLMYAAFRDVWRGAAPVTEVFRRCDYTRWSRPDRSACPVRLPERYVAVKFYDRPSFPNSPENRTWVNAVVHRLAEQLPVVSLSTSLRVDDHDDLEHASDEPVVRALDGVPAELNLQVQTAVIANAEAFVGTYGGLSYVAQAYGVPSFALASNTGGFLPVHHQVALKAAEAYDTSFVLVHPETAPLVEIARAITERN